MNTERRPNIIKQTVAKVAEPLAEFGKKVDIMSIGSGMLLLLAPIPIMVTAGAFILIPSLATYPLTSKVSEWAKKSK